jgi:preprotein translocase subunit YajC
MDTTTMVLLVVLGLLFVFYMARRRARLNLED